LKQYYVYILASKTEVLYIWVTSDLIKRVYEHKNKLVEWFTQKYNVDRLVYYEIHHDIHEAIKKEKQIKKWIRQYKINLITDFNPSWRDLYEQILS